MAIIMHCICLKDNSRAKLGWATCVGVGNEGNWMLEAGVLGPAACIAHGDHDFGLAGMVETTRERGGGVWGEGGRGLRGERERERERD